MNMQKTKTYLVKSSKLEIENFNPRFYEPNFRFVKERLEECTELDLYLKEPPKGGSTPPYYMFKSNNGQEKPFVKTSAVSKGFININDLYYIHPEYHKKVLKRSIARPNDVVFTMTGKFMGKASLVPTILPELNMSQNSVVLKTENKYKSAYLTLFLNSEINNIQVRGHYTISKQKYLNQGKIRKLKIVPYSDSLIPTLDKYLRGVELYYDGYAKLNQAINLVNEYFDIPTNILKTKKVFTQKPTLLKHILLTPEFYCSEYVSFLENVKNKSQSIKTLESICSPKVGDEIGSANYLSEGIPFIKTSDCTNYNIDYKPNYYCSTGLYHSLEQDIQFSDVILAKDGKIGETAIVTDDSRFVMCGGLVRLQSGDVDLQLLLFVILSSMVGQIQLRMWSVIASTMAHLRGDFFRECMIPVLPNDLMNNILALGHEAVKVRREASRLINESVDEINEYFLSFHSE